jgi:hypothetical protein
VQAGEGRTEPVALGGVEGRGFWLSGDAAITYDLAEDQGADEVDAYVSLFLDARAPHGEARHLLSFGDQTGIVFDGTRLLYVAGTEVWHEVPLPEHDGWLHLAWRLSPGHTEITTLVDGMALDRVTSETPRFTLDRGTLTVGRAGDAWTGVRGWIDNLLVTLHAPNPEVACNHAKGTLVEVLDAPDWSARGARYPDWAHAEIAAAAGSSETTFACVSDHTDDYAAHLANVPAGTRSLREAINFPEGPVTFGVPRPDSSDNPFCLSCHQPEGKGGLGIDALTYDAQTLAEHDRRRQPHQPPRRVFGNIPAGWIPAAQGPGGPPEAMQAPAEGLLIDTLVLPTP